MKELILIRHAKSTHTYGVRDYDRVLSERGIADAHLVGELLKKEDFAADCYISSPAARASQTASIIVEYMDYQLSTLKLDRGLYAFDMIALQSYIQTLPEKADRVCIFGHNYGLTDLVNHFTDLSLDNLPTAGVVGIRFDEDQWSQLTTGEVFLTITPKALK